MDADSSPVCIFAKVISSIRLNESATAMHDAIHKCSIIDITTCKVQDTTSILFVTLELSNVEEAIGITKLPLSTPLPVPEAAIVHSTVRVFQDSQSIDGIVLKVSSVYTAI